MKPILFNTEMVRAIQNGAKTVTRRAVKPQPEITPIPTFGGSYRISMKENVFVKPPYRHGDILYVRETWKQAACDYAGGGYGLTDLYLYKADDPIDTTRVMAEEKWRPSIHMPREAARIFLRVTDVRVEKLQDITPEQIDAEGCKEWAYSAKTGELLPSGPSWFRIAWDKTIKQKDRALYSWDANPWVWVIEFGRCEKPKEAE